MPTVPTSQSKTSTLELVTIEFGSKGSSWFAVRERTDKKLKGYRWNSSWGSWGPYVTVDVKTLTDKTPNRSCGDLPTQEYIDAEDQKIEARADQAKRRKTWVKRLLRGEYIKVTGIRDTKGEIIGRNGPRGFLVQWEHGTQSWQSGEYLKEI